METLIIPDGFKQVTREEFFSALYADKRDIMPRNIEPHLTSWETVNRKVWGVSSGWKKPYFAEAIYALKISKD